MQTYLDTIEESEQYYIPLTIVNGYGEAVLDSYPQSCTDLNIKKVNVNEIYKEPFQFLIPYDITDSNWENGIRRQNLILLFQNTQENKIALQSAKSLKASDGSITDVVKTEDKGDYLYVYISNKANTNDFAYPNVIEVVK